MARSPRFWYPGLTQHITSRGNRKANIFLEGSDYIKYLNILQETQEHFPFNLHSYCLMPNHIHLLLSANDTPTHRIIHRMHTRYAMYFNRKYNLSGHVFQGRYHASPVIAPTYFLEVSRYIHLNPLKAKMVERPEYYRWSSFSYFYYGTHHPLLHKERILRYLSSGDSCPTENYKTYVQLAMPFVEN